MICLIWWRSWQRGDVAHARLEEARGLIVASTWRRHRQIMVEQRWIADRVGVLTVDLQAGAR